MDGLNQWLVGCSGEREQPTDPRLVGQMLVMHREKGQRVVVCTGRRRTMFRIECSPHGQLTTQPRLTVQVHSRWLRHNPR